MCCIPKIKRHTQKVVAFLGNFMIGVGVNLAYRNMLPVKVDMGNLEFFSLQIQITFVWTHCLLLNDFKWTAFLDGPFFLLACYFEAEIIGKIDANGDQNYHSEVKMKQKMLRALTIYGFVVLGHFMQQKDLSVAIIQKQLLAQQ
jgi:hypothetical protein